MHGRLSAVTHYGGVLFGGVPSPFSAVRYHSLIVELESLPSVLQVEAVSETGELMALRHRTLPLHGVQFHPESICTEAGERLLVNFVRLARDETGCSIVDYGMAGGALALSRAPHEARPPPGAPAATPSATPSRPEVAAGAPRNRVVLVSRPIGARFVNSERAFRRLYGASPVAFWLDSSCCHDVAGSSANAAEASSRSWREWQSQGEAGSSAEGNGAPGAPRPLESGLNNTAKEVPRPLESGPNGYRASEVPRARYSYMGCAGGPHSALLVSGSGGALWRVGNDGQCVELPPGDLLGHMRDLTRPWADARVQVWADGASSLPLPELPPFRGGLVGFFGYESWRRIGPEATHARGVGECSAEAATPEALYIFADRFLVFDHQERCVLALCLCEEPRRSRGGMDDGGSDGVNGDGNTDGVNGDGGTDGVNDRVNGGIERGCDAERGCDCSKNCRSPRDLGCGCYGANGEPCRGAGRAGGACAPQGVSRAGAMGSFASGAEWMRQTSLALHGLAAETDEALPSALRGVGDVEVDASRSGDVRHESAITAATASRAAHPALQVGCDGLTSVMSPSPEAPSRSTGFVSDRGREAYLSDIDRVFELLRQGETYEVCLTTHFRTASRSVHSERAALHAPTPHDKSRAQPPPSALELYLSLRRVNPAPYAAFLHVDTAALRRARQGSRVCAAAATEALPPLPDLYFTVCCSSPERYLRVCADGSVESKPIKGTASRGRTREEDAAVAEALRTSGKDRAENLMITDLVRNDLGRVCRVGSVHVPSLMAVETYASVHQLVTTVRGQLLPGTDALDAAAAAFPPGSMTGAPKTRTLNIIHSLERGIPRGVYSGALGFFSVHGASDLNVVIRTAVLSAQGVSLGAGGAIVTQSQPADEWDEVLLKARPVMQAIERWLGGAADPPLSIRGAPPRLAMGGA